MIYGYCCTHCGACFERNVPVDERDNQPCSACTYYAQRLFQPSTIHLQLPEKFTHWSLKNLTPTYAEQKRVDDDNEAYLNRKKEPEKPSYDSLLVKECEQNRVDPNKLRQYTLKEAVGG